MNAFLKTIGTAAAAALLATLVACSSAPSAVPRTPNPDLPRAATSLLPEFPELFRQMTALYADHPLAPRMPAEDAGRRKVSIARVRKPGDMELLKGLQAQGTHGRIVVISLVDAAGKPLDARVLSSTEPALDKVVLQAARESEYRGGRIDGVPSPMFAVYAVNF